MSSKDNTASTAKTSSEQPDVIYRVALGNCSVAIVQYTDSTLVDSRPFAVIEREWDRVDHEWNTDSFPLPVDDLLDLSAVVYETYVAFKAR